MQLYEYKYVYIIFIYLNIDFSEQNISKCKEVNTKGERYVNMRIPEKIKRICIFNYSPLKFIIHVQMYIESNNKLFLPGLRVAFLRSNITYTYTRHKKCFMSKICARLNEKKTVRDTT